MLSCVPRTQPGRFLSMERFRDPTLPLRQRRWRFPLLIAVGVVSLVLGLAQDDSDLTKFGAFTLLVLAPGTWWFFGWESRQLERAARKRAER